MQRQGECGTMKYKFEGADRMRGRERKLRNVECKTSNSEKIIKFNHGPIQYVVKLRLSNKISLQIKKFKRTRTQQT
jgi:hypothetical protein